MNNQSEYGYDIPQIEERNQKLCLQRAKFCIKCANEHPKYRESFLAMALTWLDEYERY